MSISNSEPRTPKLEKRLGIFGGSFDPVHRGHLLLAESCLDQADLDAVWFLPTAQQPLKPRGPQASDAHRLAMLELAIRGRPGFYLSTIEIDRGGVSYMVDTLETIHQQLPASELFLLIGADSMAELPFWHRAADILRLASPLVVRRPSAGEPTFEHLKQLLSADQIDRFCSSEVAMPPTPISSSQIRRSIARGDMWSDLVPPPVADYIRAHGLYLQAR
ncbi:MAG: nicotinate (nicotinamide) nucleotide adenylyltransferase [Planctomycetales bacterium]|nr:nicotinate (nicotinamide) nucleotide adenylyltransferase [Planctomycetales bacterium]